MSSFPGLAIGLYTAAVVLTEGLAIPIIAGVAAATQIIGTETALKKIGETHQENLADCQLQQNESQQRLELARSQFQETLAKQEWNSQSIETTALQVIFLILKSCHQFLS